MRWSRSVMLSASSTLLRSCIFADSSQLDTDAQSTSRRLVGELTLPLFDVKDVTDEQHASVMIVDLYSACGHEHLTRMVDFAHKGSGGSRSSIRSSLMRGQLPSIRAAERSTLKANHQALLLYSRS